MEMKHGSHVALANLFLVVSRTQKRKHNSVRAKGGLNHVRNISLVFLVVKVG